MEASSSPIGLIAGRGLLPELIARGIRRAGRPVVCVGLRDNTDPTLPPLCDAFTQISYLRIGQQIRQMQRWGVREVLMAGKVQKTDMYRSRWRIFLDVPDFTTLWLWLVTLRHDRRTDRLLGGIADLFQQRGITMMDTTRYIPEHLAQAGVMTRAQPTRGQLADIQFALPIVARMGELDIGQAVAVRDREIIAVEAIEGTDAMIQRAGGLCARGGWTLVKLAKPQQDMRFDVPVVGVSTIENLKQAGATCLAVQAGKLIMLDKPAVIEAADRLGIAIVGVDVHGPAGELGLSEDGSDVDVSR